MPSTVRGDGLLGRDIYPDTSLISDLFEGSTWDESAWNALDQ